MNGNKSLSVNEEIVSYLKTLDITTVGFCNTEPLEGFAQFIRREHQFDEECTVYFEPSFDREDQTLWFNPLEQLPTGKSIIVLLLPYGFSLQNTLKNIKPHSPSVSKISLASIFQDYHQIMEDKLSSLHNFITVNYNKQSLGFCDKGPLNDKAIALKTGLLKIGRNSLLIQPKFGSRFYIGYLITELECEFPDIRINDPEAMQSYFHPFCKSCNKCASSCPNGAIKSFGHLSSQRCIAYLTQSNRWTMDMAMQDEQNYYLSDYVYGCDICQIVCPLNGYSIKTTYDEPQVTGTLSLEEIQGLTQKEFKRIYGKTSAGWIGKKRFIRNLTWNKYLRGD